MSPVFNDVSAELPYEPFKLNKDTIKFYPLLKLFCLRVLGFTLCYS